MSEQDIKDVRGWLSGLTIKVPEGSDITQEAMNAFIMDVIDDISDEDIEKKLDDIGLGKSFRELVTDTEEDTNE